MDDLDFHWCDLLAFRFSLRIRRSGIPLHHHRHNVHGIGCLVIVDCSSKGSGAERTQINPRKAPFTFSHGFRLYHGNHRSRSQLCQFERYELQMAAIPNTENNMEHQLSSNDGFQLQLWYSSDQNRARSMPSWNDFVEQTSQSEHTRFASFRLGCTWVDSSQDPQPCILMDSRTARLHHLIRNNTTLARISVIMPENEQWNSESITNNVLRAYSFEQSLAAEEGKSLPAINRTSISIESRPRDAVLSAFDTPSNTDGLSSVPVVVIDPSLLSGDTTTSMVSTGGMTFDYSSRHQLLEILREKGVDSLVASVVNRHDEIQTRLARTTQEMNYFSITACISITCLLGGAIMVALTLCTLRRQIMFVEYMHGAPSYLRFQSILFLAAALCSASLPIQLLIGGYNAVSTTSVSLLFIVVSLATTVLYDSRLRADSIKHP